MDRPSVTDPRRRALLRAGLAAGTLAVAPEVGLAGEGYRLPPTLMNARWTNSDGQPVQLAQFIGTPLVMTMSYAGCRRTCSTTMLILGEIQAELDRRGDAWPIVVVSFDPAQDSPAVWSEYRRSRGLTRDSWHFLTGSERDTQRLARYLDLDFWNYHGHPMHDFRIVVYDETFRHHAEIDWAKARRFDVAMVPALKGNARR